MTNRLLWVRPAGVSSQSHGHPLPRTRAYATCTRVVEGRVASEERASLPFSSPPRRPLRGSARSPLASPPPCSAAATPSTAQAAGEEAVGEAVDALVGDGGRGGHVDDIGEMPVKGYPLRRGNHQILCFLSCSATRCRGCLDLTALLRITLCRYLASLGYSLTRTAQTLLPSPCAAKGQVPAPSHSSSSARQSVGSVRR